jgi:hypothetical protein
MVFELASTSATVTPVSAVVTSSVALRLGGVPITGPSFTPATVNVVEALPIWLPPVPVAPLSSTEIVSVTAAVASPAGLNVTWLPATKAFSATRVPVSVIVVGLPPTVTPPPEVAASVPEPTDRVIVIVATPASTSVTLMPVTAVDASSVTARVAGTDTTGASFTAVMVSVTLVEAESGPPVPVLPPSSTPTERVTEVVESPAPRNPTFEPARKAFTSVTVPDSVTVPVPSPAAATPPPEVASNWPEPTERVTVIPLGSASGSPKEIPVSAVVTSSVTAMLAGAVIVGSSFTPVTTRFVLALSVRSPPPVLPPSSIVVVRTTVEVSSLAVWNVTRLAPRKLLSAVRAPVRVSVSVSLPPTVTPLPLVAWRVPEGTDRVAVSGALPASGSA